MTPGLFSRLLKPSTRLFVHEARTATGYRLFDFLHGYAYSRWPYFYIAVATGEHPLGRTLVPAVERVLAFFRGRTTPEPAAHPRLPELTDRHNGDHVSFADTYHGKVVPLAEASRLIAVNRDIPRTDLEQVIPYARAREIVLKNPDHIVVLECPCRAARENPCLPLEVCLIVGEPFASFIAEHHPRRSRWITQAEAIEILRAEDERGHVHHVFFKDAMLNRYYAICNCCSCCCGAMQAHQHGTPMLASSGFVAEVDADLCTGCEDCNTYCQFDALGVEGEKNHVNEALCMGCGVCVSKCEQGALSLRQAPEKGVPLEICKLMEQVAVVSG
jgi:Pyruvate/2-oxoacid:ferredoxin oxidoreductase delta subunit